MDALAQVRTSTMYNIVAVIFVQCYNIYTRYNQAVHWKPYTVAISIELRRGPETMPAKQKIAVYKMHFTLREFESLLFDFHSFFFFFWYFVYSSMYFKLCTYRITIAIVFFAFLSIFNSISTWKFFIFCIRLV